AQSWSFPSGHAMVSAAFYLYLAFLGARLLKGAARVAFVAILVVLVVLIGLSRLYLGVHYLTDVIAGYAAGVAWTAAVIVAARLLIPGRPRPRRRPAASAGRTAVRPG